MNRFLITASLILGLAQTSYAQIYADVKVSHGASSLGTFRIQLHHDLAPRTVANFIGLVEGMSEFIRIISFTFRLFGNMTAGEILLVVAVFLVPWIFALPFYGLELLVGFIQALIFSGLTLIFLTVAVTAHHEE